MSASGAGAGQNSNNENLNQKDYADVFGIVTRKPKVKTIQSVNPLKLKVGKWYYIENYNKDTLCSPCAPEQDIVVVTSVSPLTYYTIDYFDGTVYYDDPLTETNKIYFWECVNTKCQNEESKAVTFANSGGKRKNSKTRKLKLKLKNKQKVKKNTRKSY